jgi:hypothetical protein
MIRSLVWRIENTNTATDAVCRDITTMGTPEFQRLNIADIVLDQEESIAQAKTLLKMRTLKDVLRVDLNHLEASIYAINNAVWLDTKLIDASRKRWGAAHYLAELWLLLGVKYLHPNDLQTWIDRLISKNEDTEALRVRTTRLLNQESMGSIYNWLICQTPPSPVQHHLLWVDQQWMFVEGTIFKTIMHPSNSGLVMLGNNGLWYTLLNGGINTSLKNSILISNETMPTADEIIKHWANFNQTIAEQLTNFEI